LHCQVEDGCSGFRPCLEQTSDGKSLGCVAMKDATTYNYANILVHKEECPVNTRTCTTVEQVVPVKYVTLAGQPCRVMP
jgi:hypothetical protein